MTLLHLRTVAAAAAVLLLAGCSDEARGPAPSTTAASAAPADPTPYCRAVYDLTAASNEDMGFSPETSTRAEIRAGTIAWFGSEKAATYMDTALATAPAALAEDTRVLVDGLREYAETGDARAVGRTIGRAQGRIDRFLERACPEVLE